MVYLRPPHATSYGAKDLLEKEEQNEAQQQDLKAEVIDGYHAGSKPLTRATHLDGSKALRRLSPLAASPEEAPRGPRTSR